MDEGGKEEEKEEEEGEEYVQKEEEEAKEEGGGARGARLPNECLKDVLATFVSSSMASTPCASHPRRARKRFKVCTGWLFAGGWGTFAAQRDSFSAWPCVAAL